MKFITDLLKYFVYITTGILFVFIAILLIDGSESISVRTLIQIPLAALATALVTVLIHLKEALTKKGFYIRMVVHYVLLCVVMVIFGTAVGWVALDLAGIMTMVISTAATYAFTYAGTYLLSKGEAEELNKALKSKRERRK